MPATCLVTRAASGAAHQQAARSSGQQLSSDFRLACKHCRCKAARRQRVEVLVVVMMKWRQQLQAQWQTSRWDDGNAFLKECFERKRLQAGSSSCITTAAHGAMQRQPYPLQPPSLETCPNPTVGGCLILMVRWRPARHTSSQVFFHSLLLASPCCACPYSRCLRHMRPALHATSQVFFHSLLLARACCACPNIIADVLTCAAPSQVLFHILLLASP